MGFINDMFNIPFNLYEENREEAEQKEYNIGYELHRIADVLESLVITLSTK